MKDESKPVALAAVRTVGSEVEPHEYIISALRQYVLCLI